jgi:hypothetical protein
MRSDCSYHSGRSKAPLRLIGLCAAFLLCTGVSGKDAESGFSGTWDFDKSQSTASSDIPNGLQQQIKHNKSEMVIKSKWMEPETGVAPLVLLGVMTSELKLKTDGRLAKKQFGPFITTSSTKQDGDIVVTNWQVNANGEPMSSEWRRTLASDGKTMMLDIQQSTRNGKNSNAKLVFRRR